MYKNIICRYPAFYANTINQKSKKKPQIERNFSIKQEGKERSFIIRSLLNQNMIYMTGIPEKCHTQSFWQVILSLGLSDRDRTIFLCYERWSHFCRFLASYIKCLPLLKLSVFLTCNWGSNFPLSTSLLLATVVWGLFFWAHFCVACHPALN